MISKVHDKPYIYEYIYSNNCQYCFNPAPSLCFVDGYNVNARLVYEGLALAYRNYSKRYVPEEDKARAAKRGMWAGEFVAPWDWRRGKRLDQEEAPIACCKVCKKGSACGNSCI